MNGLERIMSAVTGTDADFQPFTLLLSLYGSNYTKNNSLDFYTNPNVWFEGQKAAIEAFDPDIVISPFSFPVEASAFGSELIMLAHYAPNIKKPIIKNTAQIAQLALPNIEKSEALQFLLQSNALLVQQYKGSKAIASPIHSPADIPALLMGIEMWIDTLLFHPAEVELMMEKTVEHFVHFGNELLANGTTFLVVPVNFTNPMMITEKIFSQLLPHLEYAFSQIKGPIVVHNGGCKIMSFIDRFAKLPNVIALVLEPTESFDQARSIIGDNIVLMGNLDGPNLATLSTEKAIKTTLDILNNRKHDKHFIFATSNADIPYDTNKETIKAVVETIRNFNKY